MKNCPVMQGVRYVEAWHSLKPSCFLLDLSRKFSKPQIYLGSSDASAVSFPGNVTTVASQTRLHTPTSPLRTVKLERVVIFSFPSQTTQPCPLLFFAQKHRGHECRWYRFGCAKHQDRCRTQQGYRHCEYSCTQGSFVDAAES